MKVNLFASEFWRRLAKQINLVLIGLLWLYTLIKLPVLPARLPIHYNGTGVPDHWDQTTVIAWLTLPLIVLCMNLFIWGLLRLVRRVPYLINLPKEIQRQAFVNQSREGRALVHEMIDSLTFYLLIPMNAIWLVLQVGTFSVATGQWKTLPRMLTGISIALVFVLLMLLIPMLNKELDRILGLKNDKGAGRR